ncbi:GLPGLI family protein [Chryseobacterium paludis]|uniref:GLPGLI family protein n=1 Tax=Chryseobacterium paludis TaxID=2956784 RepID=UPI0021C123D6|nr:GLPGLI family protein [Chryseobacterium paludis]
MRKFILIIYILSFNLSFSQTHRFIYELKYKSDSLENIYSTEEMVLDINPTDVKFYEYGFIENDSLMKLPEHQYAQHTSQTGLTISRKKDSNKNINYAQIRMMPFYYSFETIDEMKWDIQKDTKIIDKYKLQKATTNFGGRHWTAWFAIELPISEGPYKFRNLPGLILFLEDSKQNYLFSFVRNKNFPKTYDTKEFLETHYGMNPIKLNQKNWIKLNLEFYNDPYARMRTEFQPSWNVQINGRKIKAKEEFNELTKSTQNDIRKYYNPIELDKAIPYPDK